MPLISVFCYICKSTGYAGNWGIVFLPVKQIGYTLVVFTADYQWMASAAFVSKEGKHIDVFRELILVQIEFVRQDGIRQSVKMVVLKHFFFVNSYSKQLPFLPGRLTRSRK